jgi:hypothetical protein
MLLVILYAVDADQSFGHAHAWNFQGHPQVAGQTKTLWMQLTIAVHKDDLKHKDFHISTHNLLCQPAGHNTLYGIRSTDLYYLTSRNSVAQVKHLLQPRQESNSVSFSL